jgi:hypothetical protein
VFYHSNDYIINLLTRFKIVFLSRDQYYSIPLFLFFSLLNLSSVNSPLRKENKICIYSCQNRLFLSDLLFQTSFKTSVTANLGKNFFCNSNFFNFKIKKKYIFVSYIRNWFIYVKKKRKRFVSRKRNTRRVHNYSK